MIRHPDSVLNRLVAAALSIFIGLIILLGALVVRQLWLQQRIADLSGDLQANLEDLEELTDEAAQELAGVQATAGNRDAGEWEEVSEVLIEVDEQLEAIDEELDEIEMALESGEANALAPAGDQGDGVTQDQVDELFTVFAALVGIASIAVAVLLGAAVSRASRA